MEELRPIEKTSFTELMELEEWFLKKSEDLKSPEGTVHESLHKEFEKYMVAYHDTSDLILTKFNMMKDDIYGKFSSF